MKIYFMSLLLTLCANITYSQTKVIAHRGFWDTENSAQNSITALEKAQNLKIYGSEFDVQTTADGILVVNHDDTIGGMVIEDIIFDKLKDIKLNNGEKIPTLEQYLIAGQKDKNTQLILEIKPHKTKENEDRTVSSTINLVKKYNMEDQVEYISFSLNVCKELIRLSPKSQIAYLRSDLPPKKLKDMGFTGLDYHYKVLLDMKPEWLAEAKSLGLSVNVWTVNDVETMKKLIEKKVDFITTDKPEKLKGLLIETFHKK